MTDNVNLIYTQGNIGVSIKDVQTILDESSNDLGTLCTSESINMWARYKPQCTSAPIPVAPMSYYYRSIINNQDYDRWGHVFGIKIPFCDNNCVLNDTAYRIVYDADESTSWEYKQPYGVRSATDRQYYRLTDFVRNPEERTQGESRITGDPTPIELQGYNHAAPIPLIVTHNIPNSMKHMGEDQIPYYELNIQEIQSIVFTFQSSSGNDLHIQDLIDIDHVNSEGSEYRWRPILQLFDGWTAAGQDDWWERSSADLVLTGEQISTNPSSSSTLTLPLNNQHFIANGPGGVSYINNTSLSDMFHICLGIACCNSSGTSFGNSMYRNPCFILPYSKQQFQDVELPFYYRFCITNHFVGNIVLKKLEWWNSGTLQYQEATITQGVVSVPSNPIESIPYITLEISKPPINPLHFVMGNMQVASGYTSLEIRLHDNMHDVYYYLQPVSTTTDSSLIRDDDSVYIPILADSEESSCEIRAKITELEREIQVEELKTNTFYVEVKIGDSIWTDTVNASLRVNVS